MDFCLRVSMLAGLDPRGPVGGVQRQVDNLAATLAARGHDVRVHAPGPTAASLARRGYRIEVVPVRPSIFASILMDAPVLARSVRDATPDIVHLHDAFAPVGTAGGQLADQVPVVATIHNLASQFRPYAVGLGKFYGSSIALVHERWVLRRVTRLIACSPDQCQRVARAGGRDVALVPNGVDLTPSADARDLPGAPALLYVGMLHKAKGLGHVIRALALLRQMQPRAELTLVGGGSEEGALRRLAAQVGVADAVHFAGFMGDDEKSRAYAGADIAVLYSEMETFGIVLLEAMTAGIPLVASDVGGIPWVVGDSGAARIIPPRDPAALARALDDVWRDSAARERMSAVGPARAAEFSWDRVAGEVEAVYAGALMSSASSRRSRPRMARNAQTRPK